ncbi:MAG: cupin domain-containing protein [Acidimicrobiia bacterium]|nr:cupin domain-containing protein [Acidimicrobiia bacterium]
MPIIRPGGQGYPDWCELYDFSIVEVDGTHEWATHHPSRRAVVLAGELTVGDSDTLERGASFEVEEEGPVTITGSGSVVLLEGAWGSDCGGSGLFAMWPSEEPDRRGDPWDYEKNTDFDRHYHDSDEYWVIVEGGGRVVTEDVAYDVGVGDCVATRMGEHHDVAWLEEALVGVFFETTMRGRRRRGHLWIHTNGEPERRRD